ncbi:MAG: response regulator transcription factor [Pseudomonadota bacterium]
MGQTQTIRVLITGESNTARETLRLLLNDIQSIDIIEEASDAAGAIARASLSAPDIILAASNWPDRSGADAAASIKRIGLKSKVVIMAEDMGDARAVNTAFEAGVMGYAPLDTPPDFLGPVLERVHGGAPVFHRTAQQLLDGRANAQKTAREDLTPREVDILKEVARGKSNKTIADDLSLTEGTVKGYVSVILSKLGVSDRTQAALYAVKCDFVDNWTDDA